MLSNQSHFVNLIPFIQIYTYRMTTTCISQPYSLSLRNQFSQSQEQQIIIFVLSPFVYMAATINIVFFLKGKKRSQPPADILFFISIFGIFRITSYLASSIYDRTYPPAPNSTPPQSFDELCNGTGFINVMCQLADFVYNVVFCVYYVVKIKNPLKSWITDNKEIHVFCFVLIIVGTLIFYLTDLVGISILGVCGYKIGAGIVVLDIIFSGSYLAVMFISSLFFLKYLKTMSKLQLGTRIYLRFYFKYLLISSIVYLIGVITLFVATIKCLNDQSDSYFEGLTIVCNLSRILSPVMVLLVMLNHPELKLSVFLKCIIACFSKRSEKTQDPIFYQDLMTTKRTSIIIQLNSLNKSNLEQLDYLSKIKDRSKACLINTILGCLSLEEYQYLQKFDQFTDTKNYMQSIRMEDLRLSSFASDDQEIYGWNYLQKNQFQLTDDIVLAYKHIFSPKLSTVNLKFISYSSSIFKKLQTKQKIFDLYEKLLPTKNQINIIQNLSTDGGRSGQFFFFNYDRTLIIKTITQSELNVLRQRIQSYFNYFDRNPQSFIVKIYGLYKVINSQTQQQINFMLMGNILKNIPKKYIMKSFDMKGSSYQRQVLSKDQIRNSQKVQTSKTLKDIDFYVIEGKVHISKQDSDQIKHIIQEDVSFLCSQGLIDYSLILLKLNYQKLCEEEDIKIQGLKMYKSTKEQGVFYIFGIIDYLQTWNIMKKGEKWYKSIFNKKQSISSQDPKFYAQRFMKNLIMMILP